MTAILSLMTLVGYAIFLGATLSRLFLFVIFKCLVLKGPRISTPTMVHYFYKSLASIPLHHASAHGTLTMSNRIIVGLRPSLWPSSPLTPVVSTFLSLPLQTACHLNGIAVGILSTWIFNDPPRFHKASVINVVFSALSAILSVAIVFYLRRCNSQKHHETERLLREKGVGTEPGGWDSMEVRRLQGDRHPRFEFTL